MLVDGEWEEVARPRVRQKAPEGKSSEMELASCLAPKAHPAAASLSTVHLSQHKFRPDPESSQGTQRFRGVGSKSESVNLDENFFASSMTK